MLYKIPGHTAIGDTLDCHSLTLFRSPVETFVPFYDFGQSNALLVPAGDPNAGGHRSGL
jgi:hypothetical protein